MPSGASGTNTKELEGDRVGGAAADFVGSLGRKVGDARELLALIEDDPTSKAARDELRRRLHALGAGARLLRFPAMGHALQEALALLDRASQAGELRPPDLAFVGQVLDDLPALAWGDAPPHIQGTGAHKERPKPASAPMPISALVVGGEPLVQSLTEASRTPGRGFECERTGEPDKALELARAQAPDLVVVDTDLPGAPELVEALLDDPLTDPVPVVVLGSFRSPEQLARFVALGVTRTLAKPVSPEQLRATCDEVVDTHDERTTRVTLGEPTLEQLAARLADEMKRALVDSVEPSARAHRVPLGEGTEVLAALWGAISRVQEIVSQKTGGAIRFGGDAPEGAIALAPSLHQDLPGADRLAGRGRGAGADVRLNGRRVVVADDDPGVTWFISDLLRTAGCVVHEALDGATALDLAFQVQPELVVSDILMPGIDGFALCRALKRDVALRDTPVILLSWKEDLLQRVRELGASAAAYLRKESGSRAILARVREVLRPRARIELRLAGQGEVRGRLDGLTPRLLLELVCAIRKDARLSIRDATHLFEVEVRGGAPRKATRTAIDGSYQSGERALATLLGVGSGRFVVTPDNEPIHGELSGSLFDQVIGPIARARGALVATAGVRTTAVERIRFDEEALAPYLAATPEPTRTLIERLARGTTPRQLLLSGEVSPSLLEDVLSDLSARGVIEAVEGANGVDVLTPAVDAARAVMTGGAQPRRALPPSARPPVASLSASALPRALANAVRPPSSSPIAAAQQVEVESSQHTMPSVRQSASGDAEPAAPASAEVDRAPSSLADAVMREISDRSPEARLSRGPSPDRTPIVEPSVLRPRPSSPPPESAAAPEAAPARLALSSIPPDAVMPAATSEEAHAAPFSPAKGESSPAPPIAAPTLPPKPRGPLDDGDSVRAALSPAAESDALDVLPMRRGGGIVFATVAIVIAIAALLYFNRVAWLPQSPAPSGTAPLGAVTPPLNEHEACSLLKVRPREARIASSLRP